MTSHLELPYVGRAAPLYRLVAAIAGAASVGIGLWNSAVLFEAGKWGAMLFLPPIAVAIGVLCIVSGLRLRIEIRDGVIRRVGVLTRSLSIDAVTELRVSDSGVEIRQGGRMAVSVHRDIAAYREIGRYLVEALGTRRGVRIVGSARWLVDSIQTEE